MTDTFFLNFIHEPASADGIKTTVELRCHIRGFKDFPLAYVRPLEDIEQCKSDKAKYLDLLLGAIKRNCT